MTPTLRAWLQARITIWLDRTAHDGPFTAVGAFLEPGPTLAEPTRAEPLPDGPRSAAFARQFDLDPDECALLMLAAAPSMSVQVNDVYRTLRPDPSSLGASLGFICELAAAEPAQVDRLLRLATQPGGLVESGLLALRGEGPPSGRVVEVPPEIVTALAGEPTMASPALAAALRPSVAPYPWDDAAQAGLSRDDGRPLALVGGPGSGRAHALSAARGGLMVVDVALIAGRDDAVARLDEAARIVRLRASHLVLDLDGLTEARDWALIERWLARPRDVTLLLASETHLPRWLRRRLRIITAPRPTVSRAAADWREALSDWRGATDVDRISESLGQRFPMATAAIAEAVGRTPCGDLPGLHRAIRGFVPHTLEALADRYETRLTWDDVVLDEGARGTLREIELHAQRQRQVFEGWGLDRLLPYGRGLGCLFAGPPGTGKTMVAGVLANSLDRELYRVDISRVVSKWIGETEKGLARLFDEAERAGAMLFFDEADSLFARRTEVRGSNDRHANMAVNFLLQRMEAFDGISILATNAGHGIDDAFKRRLRFTVRFDEPSARQRADLWHKMLDGGLPLAEVDTVALGKKFRFTGALIKNAVVRAAFYAADRGCPIDTAMLLEAGRAELHGQGRL